jgi:hypothetical protein
LSLSPSPFTRWTVSYARCRIPVLPIERKFGFWGEEVDYFVTKDSFSKTISTGEFSFHNSFGGDETEPIGPHKITISGVGEETGCCVGSIVDTNQTSKKSREGCCGYEFSAEKVWGVIGECGLNVFWEGARELTERIQDSGRNDLEG